MKAFVANTPIGAIAVDEKGNLLSSRFYPKEPETAVKEFENGTDIENDLKGYEIQEDDGSVRSRVRKISLQKGHFSSEKELNQFLSDFTATLSFERLSSLITTDKTLAHAVSALQEVTEMENTLSMRIKEWFSLTRQEATDGKDIVERVLKEEKGIIKDYALLLQNISKIRKSTEDHVDKIVNELMPTTCTIIQPQLAGRLVAHAGSLEKLARMTASSIQLLGAEKALFRHLRKMGKSPKYGIIFMDPRIQNISDDKRGKVARIIASKVSMATKIDFYSKRKDTTLAEMLEKEMKRI
jgi:nucleolar protein 56